LNRREIGTEEEKLAAEYLRKQGMQIVEANFRSRQGEIDLVGQHEGYLVFVEVKYRSSGKGMPWKPWTAGSSAGSAEWPIPTDISTDWATMSA
jgi:hypothetical protein